MINGQWNELLYVLGNHRLFQKFIETRKKSANITAIMKESNISIITKDDEIMKVKCLFLFSIFFVN